MKFQHLLGKIKPTWTKVALLLISFYSNLAYSSLDPFNLSFSQRALLQGYVFRVAPVLSGERLALSNQLVSKIDRANRIDKALNGLEDDIELQIIALSSFGTTSKTELAKHITEAVLTEVIEEAAIEYIFTPEAGDFVQAYTDLIDIYTTCAVSDLEGCVFTVSSVGNHAVNSIAKAYNWIGAIWSSDNIYERINAINIADKYIQLYIEVDGGLHWYPGPSDIKIIADSLGYSNSYYRKDYNEEVAVEYARSFISIMNHHASEYRENVISQKPANHKPVKPSLSIDGGTSNTSARPTFRASGYYDQDGDSHSQTWWAIKSLDSDGTVWDSGWRSSNLYSSVPPSSRLKAGHRYRAYVAFKDVNGAWSDPATITFTTSGAKINSRPSRPTLSVVGGSSSTSLTPVLSASHFSDPDSKDRHFQTWWGIRKGTSGSYFWPDSGGLWASISMNSVSVPDGVLESGTTYQAAVAYMDNHGAFSYGGFVTFTTASIPEPYEPNNHIDDATGLYPSSTQYHSVKPADDVDVFEFSLNKASVINISTSGASGSTTMIAWNEDFSWVGFDLNSGPGSFSIISAEVPSGNYFAIIFQENFNLVIPSYSIRLTVDELEEVDFYLTNSDLSKTAVEAGESLNVSTRQNFVGNSSTTLRPYVGYYFSTDRSLGGGDILLADDYSTLNNSDRDDPEGASITIPSSTQSGNYYVLIVNDYKNEFAESDETNNVDVLALQVKELSIELPDLVVLNPSVNNSSPHSGEQIRVSGNVKNIGSGTAESTRTRFYISSDDIITTNDDEKSSESTGELASGEDDNESEQILAPTVAGVYWVGVCVDQVNRESNPTNNCSDGVQIVVTEPPRPDLKVTSAVIEDYLVWPNQQVVVDLKYENVGPGGAPGTNIRIFRSMDSTIDTGDLLIRTQAINPMSGHSSGVYSRLDNAPAVEGVFWYGGCIDSVIRAGPQF